MADTATNTAASATGVAETSSSRVSSSSSMAAASELIPSQAVSHRNHSRRRREEGGGRAAGGRGGGGRHSGGGGRGQDASGTGKKKNDTQRDPQRQHQGQEPKDQPSVDSAGKSKTLNPSASSRAREERQQTAVAAAIASSSSAAAAAAVVVADPAPSKTREEQGDGGEGSKPKAREGGGGRGGNRPSRARRKKHHHDRSQRSYNYSSSSRQRRDGGGGGLEDVPEPSGGSAADDEAPASAVAAAADSAQHRNMGGGGGQLSHKAKSQRRQRRSGGGGGGGGGHYHNKKHPWRKYIPPGTVDPISLDPLDSLNYPPFALVATEPYEPVKEWPVPEEGEGKDNDDKKSAGRIGNTPAALDPKEWERLIIEEQWGNTLPPIKTRMEKDEDKDDKKYDEGGDKAKKQPKTSPPVTVSTTLTSGDVDAKQQPSSKQPPPTSSSNNDKRYYHLFDGRVLAYYLLSQLQFIDPLNRRDLTREELVNLDAYLAKHKLGKAGVVEAYDSKGVTISSAGVAGQTPSGRAEILQQEARALLNALFSGGAAAFRRQQQQQYQQRQRRNQQQNEGGGRNRPNRRNRVEEGLGQTDSTGATVETDEYDADDSSFRNEFRRRYMMSQDQEESRRQRQHQQSVGGGAAGTHEGDHGVYVPDEGGGMLIIDDDVNPGLRGGYLASSIAAAVGVGGRSSSSGDDEGVTGPNTLWSASHITDRHGHDARVHSANFPALPTSTSGSRDVSPSAGDKSGGGAVGASASGGPIALGQQGTSKPSRSLQKISKVVSKTDAAELARQKEAREEAQRRAMLSKLSFVNPSTSGAGGGVGMGAVDLPGGYAIATTTQSEPNEAQLERNRNLASALGVVPSTVRQNYHSGWARPTVAHIELDEFGNELNAVQYPDSLIMEAKEQMGEVLKLEKRWKQFLADDTAPSHSLRPMDRKLRTIVHEYSDFWKLKTESFDPEPRRYVHCVKTRDTCVPHPLLSAAVSKWRGPSGVPAASVSLSRPAPPRTVTTEVTRVPGIKQQQPSVSDKGTTLPTREFPQSEDRVPLKLMPRTIPPAPPGIAAPPGAMFDWTEATILSKTEQTSQPKSGTSQGVSPADESSLLGQQQGSRFASLFEGRERNKLNLLPRTVPLELPPYLDGKTQDANTDEARVKFREAKRAEQIRRQKEEEAKRNILAEAFASSDEESSSVESEEDGGDVLSDASSSDWEVEEAVYSGSDDEE